MGSGRSGCFGLALENSDQYYTDQWQSCGDDAKPRRRPHFEPEQAEIIKAKREIARLLTILRLRQIEREKSQPAAKA